MEEGLEGEGGGAQPKLRCSVGVGSLLSRVVLSIARSTRMLETEMRGIDNSCDCFIMHD